MKPIGIGGLALTLTLAWINSSGQGDRYQFSRLDISKGLSNNQVNCILRDQHGFLWIGTMSGLNRYDGYQFEQFRHNINDSNTLSDDVIRGIMEGPDNKLWLRTRTSVDIYDLDSEKFSQNTNEELQRIGIPSGSLTLIKKTAGGDFLFVMNGHTIYKYSTSTKNCSVFYKTKPGSNPLSTIVEDQKKRSWLIYTNGLVEAIDSTGKLTFNSDLPSKIYGKDSANYSLFVDKDNDLWIFGSSGNPKGVILFHPDVNTYWHLEKDSGHPRLNTNLIVGIQQDNNGKIWICTDHGGVNILDKKDSTIQYLLNDADDDKSLSQNSMASVYKDSSGIIWLATYKRGVSYYHENITKFPTYRRQLSNHRSLAFDDVNRFMEDEKGNLWIGTNGEGLLYFDRKNDKFIQYRHDPAHPNSIANDVIVSLCLDDKHRLWIGTYFGGLDCYSNGKFEHYRHNPNDTNSLSDDRVWEIFQDSDKQLWVGTLDGGLDRFDVDRKIFHHHTTSSARRIHSNYISVIMEDNERRLWIGTNKGIEVLDRTRRQFTYISSIPNQPASLTNNDIIAIFQDSRGLIWVGTREGLNVFNKRKGDFQSFRIENGLPANAVLDILEDSRGRLWLSTDNGISRIEVRMNPDSTDPVSITCSNYGELDGLQGTEFNEDAAYKTSKGELIFGGANGFNLFLPEAVSAARPVPNLALTELQIFNRPVGVGETIDGRTILPRSLLNTSSITLKNNENILSIEFAALDFFNPQQIRYAYLLKGFNDNWVVTDSKIRKAVYTNLDPGKYIFKLKASDEEGRWLNNEVALEIIILPPFWRTNLAYIFYILVVIGTLWLARRFVLDRAEMRFAVERQRREAERVQGMDSLKTKFFTNVSHELRTPLSLILSPLDKLIKKSSDPEQKKQLHLVERNAKRLLNLVNQLLDFRKMEVQEFTLQLSRGDLIKFAREITCSFSDVSEKNEIEVSFNSNIDTLYTWFDKDKFEKILFNLLSNAFKYTQAKGKVVVDLFYTVADDDTQSRILIKVSDNGIGIPLEMQGKIFEPFFQYNLPGTTNSNGTGIGLAITKEFVKLHGGAISVESQPEKGTCFTISLPIRSSTDHPSHNGNGVVPTPEREALPAQFSGLENGNGQHNNNRRSTILVVEDSEDFRFYLKDNLKHKYNVIEAVNGREGLEKVNNLHPDLVVSDVVMPLMSGIELANKIKSNTDTSHIPVILLTALNEVETELKGFGVGINDYITKPFTFEILASRIKSLLNQQEQLRRRFQKLVEINPAQITITPLDEEFMKRAFEIVEKNIQNSAFSVEDLSKELYISRVALYKKLISLTGKSPIEFIRIMRLKRAAQLLVQSKMDIARVAYEVGFNNPKIFSRYFKEEFHETPSRYQATH